MASSAKNPNILNIVVRIKRRILQCYHRTIFHACLDDVYRIHIGYTEYTGEARRLIITEGMGQTQQTCVELLNSDNPQSERGGEG